VIMGRTQTSTTTEVPAAAGIMDLPQRNSLFVIGLMALLLILLLALPSAAGNPKIHLRIF